MDKENKEISNNIEDVKSKKDINEDKKELKHGNSEKNKRKTSKTKKKKQKQNKIINIIGSIFGIVFLMSMILIFGIVIYLDILPVKYFILFTAVFTIITFVIFFFLFNKKIKKTLKIITMFISLFFIAGSVVAAYYTYETLKFFENVNNGDLTSIEKYYVAVKSDSEYKDIVELKDFRVATFNENTNYYKEVLDKLSLKVETTLVEFESSYDVIENLLNGEVPAMLISNIHKEQYKDEHEDFEEKIRIIYTIEVETTNKEETVVTIKPASEDVMTIYISGIDTYGSINLRSRSDVNMLVTINTKTHEILMVSIPRDYYVQLHGKKGYKDKLTHAGIYGINTSIQTIQDFMGIEINYYVKVNFSTLIKVVDIIDGIDVYSDKSFTPYTDKSIYIKKGINHMNGKEALAFARERYAYSEGDRHRVKNQQDVLAAIIKKITSSETLLTKYTTLLNSVSKSFQTNVDFGELSELVKLQLDQMPSWIIKQYSLNGTGSKEYTYSMGKRNLYVMIPDDKTVKQASEYINGMTKGKKLKELGL